MGRTERNIIGDDKERGDQMKQITIYDLIPLLRDGYVSMSIDGDWWFHNRKPLIFESDGRFIVTGEMDGYTCCLQEIFNIKRFKGDWKDSLIKVEHKDKDIR